MLDRLSFGVTALPEVGYSCCVGKFFTPNITPLGRVVRTIWGLACIIGAIALRSRGNWAFWLLLSAGGFGLFEAIRGWCIVRACGIKTRF
jgi:hypothetical protein